MHAFITPLNHLSRITLAGPQQAEYLQGQVTIDVNRLTPEQARLGGHCDFKGKLWSVFYAINDNHGLHLLMHKQSAEKSLSELKKYGVFSKVDISDSSENVHIYGAAGSQAVAIIDTLFAGFNKAHLALTANEFGQVLSFNDRNQRFILLLSPKGQEHMRDIAEALLIDDAKAFDALELEAGIANIQAPTSNEFVPQMLNLQALDAIDFDKGCYMGQETVARTKFLGKNKRAAYILHGEQAVNADALLAGEALEKQAGENWRSGGTIVRSAFVACADAAADTQKTAILAVLANDTQVGDMLRLKAHPEVHFIVQPLPYSLESK